MNTQDQLARMQHWLDTHPATPNPFTGPRILEDPDTLRRSRLSMAAARAQRRWSERPTEPWADELATRAERAWGGEAS